MTGVFGDFQNCLSRIDYFQPDVSKADRALPYCSICSAIAPFHLHAAGSSSINIAMTWLLRMGSMISPKR